ncbi:MAG: sensor histidine kinase [Oceanicaulis sp.]
MSPPLTSMADAVARYGWEDTALGPRHAWPALLDCAAHLALDAAFPTVVLWGKEAVVAAYNDAYGAILGENRDALGRPLPLVWPEAGPRFAEEIAEAQRGKTVFKRRARFDITRDGRPQRAWFDYSFSPIRGEDGEAEGVLFIVQERTAEVEAEERQLLLNQELSHRVKNTLAIVGGLARLSFSNDAHRSSVKRFKERLQALGVAQQLIFEGDGTMVALDDIIESATVDCREQGRLTLDGAPVWITAGLAGKLALVLHELCDNAAKHGALAHRSGSATLSWTSEPGGAVRVRWRETSPEPLADEPRRGFGLLLIQEMFRGEPGAGAELRFEPDGAVCDITLPTQG